MLTIPGHLPSSPYRHVPDQPCCCPYRPCGTEGFAVQPCQFDSNRKQTKTMLHPTKTKRGLLILLKKSGLMCELSCWWALMPLPFCKTVLWTAAGSEKETSLEHTQFKKEKKSIPCLAESFSVKQVIAPCLLSCHSCLLLDAHNKSTVVWTAALCWNLTIPRIFNHALFQYSPNWKLQVYLENFQYTRSDSNS